MVAVQPLRLAEHLLGRTLHDDAAAAHDQNAVGLGGLLHIMGDGHNGDARLAQLADGAHDLCASVGVQHGGGLVQNQAVGPHGDNARNGDALLLPAGQLIRRCLALFVDACQLHGLVDAGADLRRRHTQIFRRKGDVFLHDGGNDLVVGVLEHHAHLLADIVEMLLAAGVHILHQHGAGFGQQNGVEMLGQGAFAAAVRTQHRHKFTAANLHRNAVHRIAGLFGVIAEFYVLHAQHRVFIRHSFTSPRRRLHRRAPHRPWRKPASRSRHSGCSRP